MSFAEILVIAVVALFIVGPEKLPETIRNGMLWFGRVKRAINNTKAEFEQQLGVDEVRRELHNEQVLKSLKVLESTQRTLDKEADVIEGQLQDQIKKIEDGIDDPVHHDEKAPAGNDDKQKSDA